MEQGLLRPSSAVAAACDPAATRRFLELLRAPEVNCTEFRVLRAGLNRPGQSAAPKTSACIKEGRPWPAGMTTWSF